MSRSHNSFFNIITSLFAAILGPLLSFVTRTVFIRCLGTSYLGVEGLFSNILNVLSLTELGFGVAINYALYEPIERGDVPRIQALMDLYRRIYIVVGAVILCVGLCLIPLLPSLVKDYERFAELGLNAVVIFLIYLLNSAISYWFWSYKSMLVHASQKEYLLSILGYVLSVANSAGQILVLLLTRSFVLYLLVNVIFCVLRNLINAAVCDRRYPFMRQRATTKVSEDERRRIFRDCGAAFLHRANNVALTASDNIVLSALAGLDIVGLYANYLSVKTAIISILRVFTYSIQASVGSLMTEKNDDWSRLMFRTVHYVSSWIYGVGGIGAALLLNDFITLWLGPSYVVTSWTPAGGVPVATPLALLVGIELYLTGQGYAIGVFRDATGLFQPLKYRPILSILVNLGVSLLTVPRLGIAGCVIGTIAALLTTELLIDPIVLHRLALHDSSRGYFVRNVLYGLLTAGAGLLCRWLCALIPLAGVVGFIARGLVCVVVPSGLFVLTSFRTREFQFLLGTARSVLPRPNKKESR